VGCRRVEAIAGHSLKKILQYDEAVTSDHRMPNRHQISLTMNLKKTLTLLGMSIAASGTPALAQIDWSSQTIAAGTWLVSIAYGNGTWLAVGAGGTILVSTNLTTWGSARAVTTNKLNGVLYADGIFVAVGDSATIITSPDGLNWTTQIVPANLGVTGFLHGIT